MMPAIRASQHDRIFRREEPLDAPLITVRAGEVAVVRVAAVDRQSGVAEVVARCRARDNHELRSLGQWSLESRRGAQPDNYYVVPVPIPERSPTVIWEVYQIALCDRDGNRKSYAAGKDFAPLAFQVLAREGLDCTPPRLLAVQVVPDAPDADGD